MTSSNRSFACVLNEKASECTVLPQTFKRLRDAGHSVGVFPLADITNVFTHNWDIVVAVGGDGTLHHVVTAILERGVQTIVGVVPYGSGNDFATACGLLPNDPDTAFTLLQENEPRTIDLGAVNGKPFINAISGGFGAEVTAETSKELKAIFGKLAYSITGLGKALQPEDRFVRIRGEDFEWQGELLGLCVANGRLAGGGFHVAPDALLDDGLLDALIIPYTGLLDGTPILLEMFLYGTINGEHVCHVRTPWLEVEPEQAFPLSIDGEPEEANSFRVEVLKHRLSIILPEQAPLK